MSEEYKHIDLDKLKNLCKGDTTQYLKYLKQFSGLISMSINKLIISMEEENTEKIFQEIHFMLPQLQFFGIDDFTEIMTRKPDTIQFSGIELKMQINSAITKIKMAIVEVDQIVEHLSKITPK